MKGIPDIIRFLPLFHTHFGNTENMEMVLYYIGDIKI
jgi:hypothetical protein